MLLPVSGLDVRFHSPDGNDDLAILEATGNAVERALSVLPRLVLAAEAGAPGQLRSTGFWEALTVSDFEAALLGLRRHLLGDMVTCLYRDPGHECEVRMEVGFSIAALLDRARPGAPKDVHAIESEPGWFCMDGKNGAEWRFRLPTVSDQLQAMAGTRGAELLMQRCMRSEKKNGRAAASVERAMEALAPPVSQPLAGNCPECGKAVAIPLHVPQLVMDELRASAAAVHEEIDRIAAAYHWEEAVILAMPQSRRRAYAKTIQQRLRGAE